MYVIIESFGVIVARPIRPVRSYSKRHLYHHLSLSATTQHRYITIVILILQVRKLRQRVSGNSSPVAESGFEPRPSASGGPTLNTPSPLRYHDQLHFTAEKT